MGDPYPYRTITSIESTNYTSTQASYYDTSDIIYVLTQVSSNDIKLEKLSKKLLKQLALETMMQGWTEKIQYIPQLPIKPISLRGVCFNGRGWA